MANKRIVHSRSKKKYIKPRSDKNTNLSSVDNFLEDTNAKLI